MQNIDTEALKKEYETATNPKAKLKLGFDLVLASGQIGAFDDVIRIGSEMLPIADSMSNYPGCFQLCSIIAQTYSYIKTFS